LTAGEDSVQLLVKVVLWLHATLDRLTNGRIGGRFIAGSPILLLTTTGRRTGKRRTRPLTYVRVGERYVLCASNGGSPTHRAGITTWPRPAGPRSRSALSTWPSPPGRPTDRA
jgi:F420H(2)-dependent quinone reductase